MSTHILSIDAVSSPFDFDTDNNSRQLVVCNYNGEIGNTSYWEDDILIYLDSENIVDLDNCFVGDLPVNPNGSGPFVTIKANPSPNPLVAHDNSFIERIGFQIVVRSDIYESAKSMSRAIYEKLITVHNVVIP